MLLIESEFTKVVNEYALGSARIYSQIHLFTGKKNGAILFDCAVYIGYLVFR